MDFFKGVFHKAVTSARSAVSGDKHRYQKDGYDLDLTYILPNIIAMGKPSDGIDYFWRNYTKDVSDFLKQRHGENYIVYNLMEKPYECVGFGDKTRHFGWLDHHAPPLKLLYDAVIDMDRFLSTNDDNVAAVHCKAGKGRTGTLICSYLLFKGIVRDPETAITLFKKKRLRRGKGVETPSQRLAVICINRIFKGSIPSSRLASPRILRLQKIIVSPALNVQFGIDIYVDSQREYGKPVYTSPPFDKSIGSFLAVDCGGVSIGGSILLRAYLNGLVIGPSNLFRIWFDTSFIEDDACYIDFGINDIDDAKNKKFRSFTLPLDLRVRFLFQD